ncbi:hypothetical protein BSY87_04260 [Francisella tularensis subsp. holarctica FSC022]|uniref:cation:proton antiporter domain-containing protein n=1 Tax=Francisella tularensis TaxID=263 RepID=UPI00015D7862|nr:cation:proton antiporter [Francisella tularensis]EDO66314.1 conserved hypothetical protein [Francisella tularensis subsp. holarctica FSC022]KIP30810.1 sodium/hydrogen exchanger family protein [Francisella tularensis subsp. holarctica]MCC9171955.1 cation:proton antiporter [Francisella tularensis]OPH23910.1 hypothetical protein BSY87_04260 [Francisella tularensis subsp. holarctica FSC022]BCL52983.1 hypothetical protein JPFTNV_08680 [Francisella tularensis subsp. holarctica]
MCLLIGAIISPTDPVTLLKFLNLTKICQKRLKILLEGESLFNDVVSIVLFTMFVGIIDGNSQDVSIFSISELLLREGLGGILLGSVIGYASSFLMKSLDDSNALVLVFSKDTYVMTWAGLRGGVSIALSLPEDSSSMFIFLVIYVYVITSIFIKGISLKRYIEFLL